MCLFTTRDGWEGRLIDYFACDNIKQKEQTTPPRVGLASLKASFARPAGALCDGFKMVLCVRIVYWQSKPSYEGMRKYELGLSIRLSVYCWATQILLPTVSTSSHCYTRIVLQKARNIAKIVAISTRPK